MSSKTPQVGSQQPPGHNWAKCYTVLPFIGLSNLSNGEYFEGLQNFNEADSLFSTYLVGCTRKDIDM